MTFAAALDMTAASVLRSCSPASATAAVASPRTCGPCKPWKRFQVEPRILAAVDDVNNRQKFVLYQKVSKAFPAGLNGKTVAVWGLAFKPRTDDIREAPALVLIDQLLEAGAKVQVHDPEAMDNVRRQYGDRLVYAEHPYDALDGADALAIATEWKQFLRPDFDEMRKRMKTPLVFDGRNLYEPAQMKAAGFTYHCIGRMPVSP